MSIPIRLTFDPVKKGLSTNDALLEELVREQARKYPALYQPYHKTKTVVKATDGTVWFVFGLVLLETQEPLLGHVPMPIIELVDCVPAQKTSLGCEWFEELEGCLNICARRWRTPGNGPRCQREMEAAARDVENLVASVEGFADSLPAGQAAAIEQEGLRHLIYLGRMALNAHYRDSASETVGSMLHLELALWHTHEFILKVGSVLGFNRVM